MKVTKAVLFLCITPVIGLIPTSTDRYLTAELEQHFHISAPAFPVNQLIRAVARKHNVNPAFVKSIMAAESRFLPDAISPKGAIGLMQLMPETARDLGADPAVPEQNVEAGAMYLGLLLKRYDHKRDKMVRAIAAYNAGPGNVDRYRGVPPFRETKAYVARVLKYYKRYESQGIDSD